MRQMLHPAYAQAQVTCSCGSSFQTRSTRNVLSVEVCSACHPFYTGKQKSPGRGGRIEQFEQRLRRARR